MTSPGNPLLHAITREAYAKTDRKQRIARGHRDFTPGEKATILSAWGNGYTQKELAHIYGVSPATISQTINNQLGKKEP